MYSNQLFVYGSLRSDAGHPAHAYMNDSFTLMGPAKVKGEVYDLGEYPAAVPTGKEAFITGELYILKQDRVFDEAIQPLDEYEGLFPVEGEVPLYRRELTTVYMNSGSTTAWVYWYNNSVSGKPLIASGDVIQYIRQNK